MDDAVQAGGRARTSAEFVLAFSGVPEGVQRPLLAHIRSQAAQGQANGVRPDRLLRAVVAGTGEDLEGQFDDRGVVLV